MSLILYLQILTVEILEKLFFVSLVNWLHKLNDFPLQIILCIQRSRVEGGDDVFCLYISRCCCKMWGLYGNYWGDRGVQRKGGVSRCQYVQSEWFMERKSCRKSAPSKHECCWNWTIFLKSQQNHLKKKKLVESIGDFLPLWDFIQRKKVHHCLGSCVSVLHQIILGSISQFCGAK